MRTKKGVFVAALVVLLCLAIGYCTNIEFQCNDGECIPMSGRCDSFPHCADSSDEANCLFGRCLEGQQLCADGVTCITPDKWCDGTADCPDSSDEHTSCGGMTTTTPSKSSPPVPNTCTKSLHASTTAANTGGMTTTTPTPTTSSSSVPLVTITRTKSIHASTTAANTGISTTKLNADNTSGWPDYAYIILVFGLIGLIILIVICYFKCCKKTQILSVDEPPSTIVKHQDQIQS